MLRAIQISAVVVVRERSRSARSSRTEERGSSGGAVSSPGSTGLPVISVSTSAASSLRPCRARKYGLSGSERRATKASSAGNEAARKSQRQLLAPPMSCPMKIHERKVASSSPTGHQKSRKTSRRPRRCGGRYSVSIDGSTTSIPPSPRPARKRNVITDHGPQESAVTAVKIAYQRIEYWKIVRRPIRSARRPSASEPQSEPASAALLTSPCMRPFSPHCAAKIGATKPTSRISIATNVQAAPVTRIAFLWKRERPPSRRTCSTSRAGIAMLAVVIFG